MKHFYVSSFDQATFDNLLNAGMKLMRYNQYMGTIEQEPIHPGILTMWRLSLPVGSIFKAYDEDYLDKAIAPDRFFHILVTKSLR